MALTPDKVRTEYGLIINEKIIPWNSKWPKDYIDSNGIIQARKGSQYKQDKLLSGGTGKIKYITVHNTGGSANAETYTRATWPNANMGWARVHYYVDDTCAWQNLKDNEVGYHAGDSGKVDGGNMTSIGIEIIMGGAAIRDNAKSEDNGALLVAILLNKYGLTINDVRTHNYWMGLPNKIVPGQRKNCPVYILPHWDAFVAKVKSHLSMIQNKQEVVEPPKVNIPVISSYKIDDVVRIKKGALWINNKIVPQFVLNSKMYVTAVYTDGTVVVSTSKRGATTGRIKTSWLDKI